MEVCSLGIRFSEDIWTAEWRRSVDEDAGTGITAIQLEFNERIAPITLRRLDYLLEEKQSKTSGSIHRKQEGVATIS